MSIMIGTSFGKPKIDSISIPDVRKRRVPNKFYVYKIVVEWSNSQTVTVYRRYSNFFDFWCKLKELHSTLLAKSLSYQDSNQPLPDMPGKIYLGRSQVHQVAEKRRKKLQEFCQQLIKLPFEISQSTIVYGFFSLWPDDTISGQQVRRHTAVGRSVIKPDLTSSVQIPSPASNGHPLLSENSSFLTGMELSVPSRKPRSETIDTADLMDDSEEHYRVVQDYTRLDSQQLDLKEGQIVTVVEKHDTGWWMIEFGDEQGYAPASILEAVDENGTEHHVEENTIDPEEYVVLEDYSPNNEDELLLSKGDAVQVVAVVLDGWWKVKKGNKVGYAPASILRKKGMDELTRTLTRESQMFLNDRTLLRSSTRFPPRHSFSKHSFLKKLRRHTESPKKGPSKKQGPHVSSPEPIAPPQPLPPSVRNRYEMCQPGDVSALQNRYEVFQSDANTDEDPEEIYKVPRSIGVNFNASNNLHGDDQSKETGNDQSEETGKKEVNIYNMVLSPPVSKTDSEALYYEIPPLPQEPNVEESGGTVSGSGKELDTVVELSESDNVPAGYFSHLKSREPLGSVSSWSDLQAREYPSIDPKLLENPEQKETAQSEPNQLDGKKVTSNGKKPLMPPPRGGPVSATSQVSKPSPKKPPPPTRPKPPLPPQHPDIKDKLVEAKNKMEKKEDTTEGPDPSPLLDASTESSALSKSSSPPTRSKHGAVKKQLVRFSSHPDPVPDAQQSPNKSSRPAPKKPIPYSRHVSAGVVTESRRQTFSVTDQHSEPDLQKRPLPELPNERKEAVVHPQEKDQQTVPEAKEMPLRPPARKPRFPDATRDRAVTVAARPEPSMSPTSEVFEDYLFFNSGKRRVSSDEYVDIDDEFTNVLPTLEEDPMLVGGRQITPDQQESCEQTVSPVPPQSEQKGRMPPPVPHVLSTETPDVSTESIVSRNVEELSVQPSSSPVTSEGVDPVLSAQVMPVGPQLVDYENVTLDLLNVDAVEDDPELYQNVSNPSSEYANMHYTPNRKPGVDNLGIFIAIRSCEPSDKCICVRPGDEGVKLAESKDWWYMKVDNEEGWTPRDLWEPTEETKTMLIQENSLSKKKSFNAADGVKPKTAPPKPMRGLDKINEDGSPPPLPSRNVIGSPGQPSNKPSNQPSNQQKGNLQQRPLPKIPTPPSEPPSTQGSGQYVCDTDLALESQPWFCSTMDRPESEKLLTQPSIRNREFIVRERKNKAGYYALSVRHHYSVRHFNIDPQPDGMFIIGSRTFQTIPEVILYYQKHSLFNEGANSQPVTLSCPAKLTRPRAATSFR